MVDEKIVHAMISALEASMNSVKFSYQDVSNATHFKVVKPDSTLLALADIASERAGLNWLSDIAVHAEESGKLPLAKGSILAGGGKYTVLFDPLDGTRPFVCGAPTSTVIIGLYDNTIKQVVGCFVGIPANQYFWQAMEGSKNLKAGTSFCFAHFLPLVDGYHQFPRHVWKGSLNPKSTVYLDLYPGFTRVGCKTLSVEEQSKLFNGIHGKVSAVSMMGSNGLHHALVANGGEGVAGAITTALGGPWDVAPVALVLASGGAARAFSRGDDGVWVDRDPRDVYSYDFLVTGNSLYTVETLSQILLGL